MKTKVKYLGFYILVVAGSIAFASLLSGWFNTSLSWELEYIIGIVLFDCIGIGICTTMYMSQRKNKQKNEGVNYINLIMALAQWTILMISYYGIYGGTLVLVGLIAIFLQMAFEFRIIGWIAIVAYPITYWISGLLDRPGEGNHWVLWVFSYIGVTLLASVLEVFLKTRKLLN